MTEQPGGYRPPANPAPVSGPGALSQRTDVQAPMPMTGGPYGEAQEMQQIQSGAPMMAEPDAPSAPAPTGLFAPPEDPNEPVTAGMPFGDGPGQEVLMGDLGRQKREIEGLQKYIPMMERMAGRMDAPDAFRALVKFIRANQSA